MNLFVTGANGYIGSNFIKKASSNNFKIFALTTKKRNKKIKNVKWLVGKIDKNWSELKQTDILVHLAAKIFVPDSIRSRTVSSLFCPKYTAQ